ncbi:hypothetical protein EON65_02270 [archaeon]|nr:MAG: hypothetical protein EON65_02270 [archaeon]
MTMLLADKNFDAALMSSNKLSKEQKKRRKSIHDLKRYYFRVLCLYLFYCNEKGKFTHAIKITQEGVTVTPVIQVHDETEDDEPEADEPEDDEAEADEDAFYASLDEWPEEGDTEIDENSTHEVETGRCLRSHTRKTDASDAASEDIPVGNTNKRSCSVAHRPSAKKRRTSTGTETSIDEAMVADGPSVDSKDCQTDLTWFADFDDEDRTARTISRIETILTVNYSLCTNRDVATAVSECDHLKAIMEALTETTSVLQGYQFLLHSGGLKYNSQR